MKRKISSDLVLQYSELTQINDQIQAMIDRFSEQIPGITITEYAEAHRILPTGTPFPGPYRVALTPYMREIQDNLSVRSKTEETIFLKASQIGATASIENYMAYVIAVAPGPILMATAKDDLAKKWVSKRLTPLLKSCNLEDRIFKQHALKGSRATGNTQTSKEFPAGSLDVISAQTESNLRQDSIRYLILDEAEAYPVSVSGLGDPIEIARARTANWGSRKRIFIPSTPTLEGESRMWQLFKEGDQRRFFVDCPLCGKGVVLKFPSEPEYFYEGLPTADLGWEMKAGKLDAQSVHVKCPHCGGKISESKRYTMVQAGRWIPTAEASRPAVRSYQLGRLYSLMDTWDRLALKEIQAQQDPLLLQAHHNLNCGIPFRETTQKPDISKIYELRGTYDEGEIPTEDVLFLTGAVDVQRGKANDPSKPPRVEVEICAHGYAYRTWSMYYKVFPGPVNDPYGGAWQDLYDWVASGGMTCRRSDGLTLQPRFVFVDSGDGVTETAVFDFCHRLQGFIPIKGVHDMKETAQGRRAETILDEKGPRDRDRFREHMKYDQTYLSIHTVWYKSLLWRSLKIPRQPGSDQRPRFCEFPRSYPDRYFDQLVAEERREDGSFWRPESRANEALDLRIYCMCAADYFLFKAVQAERKAMSRAPGWTKDMADRIQSRHIIDRLVQQMKRKLITH